MIKRFSRRLAAVAGLVGLAIGVPNLAAGLLQSDYVVDGISVGQGQVGLAAWFGSDPETRVIADAADQDFSLGFSVDPDCPRLTGGKALDEIYARGEAWLSKE